MCDGFCDVDDWLSPKSQAREMIFPEVLLSLKLTLLPTQLLTEMKSISGATEDETVILLVKVELSPDGLVTVSEIL